MTQDPLNTERSHHARLIEAVARDGDREAFATLFAYFAPRIAAWLRRQGCERALAEELAQETMLLVWQKAARYDAGRAEVATWIYTIARNLRIDALRRERHPSVLLQEPTAAPASVPQPDEQTMAQEHAVRLRAALRQLPREQAAVVHQTFFASKAQTEIRDALQIPLGTVKSRLRLAIVRLRSALGDLG